MGNGVEHMCEDFVSSLVKSFEDREEVGIWILFILILKLIKSNLFCKNDNIFMIILLLIVNCFFLFFLLEFELFSINIYLAFNCYQTKIVQFLKENICDNLVIGQETVSNY